MKGHCRRSMLSLFTLLALWLAVSTIAADGGQAPRPHHAVIGGDWS